MRNPTYNNLPERLAILLYGLWDNENRPDVCRADVLKCFFGSKYRGHYGSKPLPTWWNMLGEKFARDRITRIDKFTPQEKKHIIHLREDGISLNIIKKCFGLNDAFMDELDNIKPFLEETAHGTFAPKRETPDGAEELSNNDEIFDSYFCPDPSTRAYANSQMAIYKEKVDFNNPVNVSTVRTLIVLQIKLRDLERQLVNPQLSDNKLDQIRRSYEALRTTYSFAAKDVAMLESQKEMIREGENFDDVLSHVKDALREWRDIEMPLRMEESHLIEEMVRLHRVDMNITTTEQPRGEHKDPNKTRNTQDFFVLDNFNTRRGEDTMPVESDGE